MGRFLPLLAGCICILLLNLDGIAAEQPAEAVLESISYEKDANNNEKIIFKLNGAHIPKVFKIKGERPRLVFDFLDTRYSDLINRIADTKGSLIQGVRVGIHNDPPKTRVVIDLKPEGDFQFEQDFLVRENTLSITFHPDEPAVAPTVTPAPQPEPVKPEPAKPEFAKPEPAKPEFAKPEPAKPEPAKPEPAKPVPAQPEPEVAAAPPAPEQPDPDTAFSSATQPAETEQAVATEAQPTETAAPESQPEAELVAAVPPVSPGVEPPLPSEPTPAEPVDPVLRDVSFETTADNTEMVLFKLNDFYPPIVFGIEKGTPRVVCDFLDTALDQGVRHVLDTKGNYISRVRVAKHTGPDKVRVVLDLVPNRNYDLQQVFFKEDNLFIVLINEFEEEAVPAAEVNPPAAPKS